MSPQLWRYSIPSEQGEGWAVFVLGSDGYFSSVSDYGNYAFLWCAHECRDFREFLLHTDRDWDYFVRKLSPGNVYDGEATERGIRETILRLRRDRSLSMEEARTEWDLASNIDLDSEIGFHQWYIETALSDAWEYGQYRAPEHVVQFVRKCMVRLIPLLRADLERDALRLEEAGR